MVALVLRLRLAQLSNGLRRGGVQLLGLVVLLAFGVALTGYLLDAFGALASASAADAATGTVLIGSVVTLGFVLVPLLLPGDDPLDARSFTPLGRPRAGVVWGLALAAVIGVPTILLIVVAAGFAHSWAWNPDAAPIASLAAVLIVLTGVLGARLARSFGAVVLMTRGLREAAGIVLLLVLLAATPFVLMLLLGGDDPQLQSRLGEWAAGLSDSPLGFAWAAPVAAAAGDSDVAWQRLGMAALVLGVVAVAWHLLALRMQRMPAPRLDGSPAREAGLGWFDVMPATLVGAIAGRSFSYWMRDGRYKFALAVIPVVAVLVVVPFAVVGVWWQNLALIPLPVMCLFLGWLLHNDLAHDNTALWLHVAADTPGWADRIGRIVPVLVLGVPMIAVFAPLSAWGYGDWSVLPSVFGVSVCVLLSGIGISSYTSARMPYAAVRPGASPFSQPQSSSGSSGQAVAFFGTIVVSLPVLWLAGLGLAEGGDWPMLTLLGGLVLGLLVLLLGVWAGGRVFTRQAPELLAFTLRN